MLDVPKCKQKCKHETYNQQIVSSKESQIIILSSVEKLYYWVQSGNRTVLVRSSTKIVLRTRTTNSRSSQRSLVQSCASILRVIYTYLNFSLGSIRIDKQIQYLKYCNFVSLLSLKFPNTVATRSAQRTRKPIDEKSEFWTSFVNPNNDPRNSLGLLATVLIKHGCTTWIKLCGKILFWFRSRPAIQKLDRPWILGFGTLRMDIRYILSL